MGEVIRTERTVIVSGIVHCFEVTGLDSITEEEYIKAADVIPETSVFWIKGTPDSPRAGLVINCAKQVYNIDERAYCDVRPVMSFKCKNMMDVKRGDRLTWRNASWTVITPGRALCDTLIEGSSYAKTPTSKSEIVSYENSKVKERIDKIAARLISGEYTIQDFGLKKTIVA